MVVVFNKTCPRFGNAEYNYHDSLQARLVEGIGHCNLVREDILHNEIGNAA